MWCMVFRQESLSLRVGTLDKSGQRGSRTRTGPGPVLSRQQEGHRSICLSVQTEGSPGAGTVRAGGAGRATYTRGQPELTPSIFFTHAHKAHPWKRQRLSVVFRACVIHMTHTVISPFVFAGDPTTPCSSPPSRACCSSRRCCGPTPRRLG